MRQLNFEGKKPILQTAAYKGTSLDLCILTTNTKKFFAESPAQSSEAAWPYLSLPPDSDTARKRRFCGRRKYII